jgi:cytoskeleton protein RodZ
MSESIGQILLQARNARGIGMAEAAARLHCDEAVLAALEAERFDELGAPVFVQGHLRRYAEFIGAPVDVVMAGWSELRATRLADPDLSRIPRAPAPRVDPQAWGRRLTVLGVAISIAVAAWWVLSAGAPSPAVSPVATTESQPAAESQLVTAAQPVTEAQPAAESQALAEPQPLAESGLALEPVPAPAPSPESVSTTEASTPASDAVEAATARLLLAPRVPSWIELYDATGKRWYWGLAAAEVPLRFRVQAPVQLILGRADAVAIEWNGRALNVPSELIFNSAASLNINARGVVTRYQRAEQRVD